MIKKILVCLLVLLTLFGCSNKTADNGGSKENNYSYDSAISAYDNKSADEGRKIVYSGNINVETEDWDKTIEMLEKDITKYGIIIQSVSQNGNKNSFRYATYSLRVPVSDLETFLAGSNEYGNVISSKLQRDDITEQYNDTSIQIEALEVQKDRLMTMLKEAKSVDDMLEISDRLTELEARLNQYRSHLASMDGQIQYSPVTIYIEEVNVYTEGRSTKTFWDRLKNALSDSWHSLLEFLEDGLFRLIEYLPRILILGAIGFALFKAIKKLLCVIKAQRGNAAGTILKKAPSLEETLKRHNEGISNEENASKK